MADRTKRQRGVRGAGSAPTRRADGRWEAKLDLGLVDGKRRRKTVYGRTPQEAQQKLTRALYEHRLGLPVADGRVTLRQFLEQGYLPEAARLEPATYRLYEQTVRVHLVPALGHIQLAKLSVQQVQRFLNDRADRAYAPRTVANMRAVLRQALGLAETWGLVPRNVAKLVKVPRMARPATARRFLSVAEATRLLAAARGERLEALYTVALMLGLRQGEALALHWADVDLAERTLLVDEAVGWVKGVGLRFKATKTHQVRTIPLPQVCVAALAAHRDRQAEERLAMGARWHEHDLIFCTRYGTPLEGTNVSKYFKRVLHKAGLPDMRYYDLRHSAASLLAAQGVPARVAMETLGHSDIRLTMNTYTHVLEEAKWRAAAAMDDLFPPEPR